MPNTILIIDESSLSIEIIEKALIQRNENDVILSAFDVDSSIEKIKRYSIDLIIIDSILAQKNEFELIREIAKIAKTKLILTTNLVPAMSDYICSLASIYSLKIASIIKKPISTKEVIEATTLTLNGDPSVEDDSQYVENYDISLLYQPKFKLSQKKIVGFEILSRWADSGDQTFSKHMFLPLISKKQLHMKKNFNLTVIHHFIEDYNNHLYKLPTDLSFSINIDVELLTDSDLIDALQIVSESNFKHQLIIEISGNDINKPIEENFLDNLRKLKSFNFELSIDKFGYAPINYQYIKSLSIDEVKIDRSVTNDFCTGTIDKAEIYQAIDIAKQMDARIVFEGIESQHMSDIIKDLDGEYIQQGFFYCVPIPPTLLSNILES